MHIKATDKERISSQKAGEAPIEKCIRHMEKEHMVQVKCLFNTAFYVVVSERPFKDFTGLVDLQKKNNVSIGDTYCSDKQCVVFIQYIYQHIQAELTTKLKNSDFFSVMTDGATDSATLEEEIIYVRHMYTASSH